MELLAALGPSRCTGRELAKRYRELTRRNISYGSLYPTMARMSNAGWVEQTEGQDTDGRLRFFRLTGKGIQVWTAAREYHCRLFGLGEGAAA